ncbi:hypothetical protein NOF04DRAFT_1306519 [Fusarium oxysporum II5]|nr:hypothetical protein NOF04DRAFT_1306519 [Fusarium oxysporum II5]
MSVCICRCMHACLFSSWLVDTPPPFATSLPASGTAARYVRNSSWHKHQPAVSEIVIINLPAYVGPFEPLFFRPITSQPELIHTLSWHRWKALTDMLVHADTATYCALVVIVSLPFPHMEICCSGHAFETSSFDSWDLHVSALKRQSHGCGRHHTYSDCIIVSPSSCPTLYASAL